MTTDKTHEHIRNFWAKLESGIQTQDEKTRFVPTGRISTYDRLFKETGDYNVNSAILGTSSRNKQTKNSKTGFSENEKTIFESKIAEPQLIKANNKCVYEPKPPKKTGDKEKYVISKSDLLSMSNKISKEPSSFKIKPTLKYSVTDTFIPESTFKEERSSIDVSSSGVIEKNELKLNSFKEALNNPLNKFKNYNKTTSPPFLMKHKIEKESPFNAYSPSKEPMIRNDKIEKSISGEIPENVFRNIRMYSPGAVLTKTPRLRIVHVSLVEDSIKIVFEVISDVSWFVEKDLRVLRSLIKQIPKETMDSNEPEKLRFKRELIEIYVNSGLGKDHSKLQSFILTGVVDDFSLRSGFIYVKLDMNWVVVNAKVVNKSLILYRNQTVSKIVNLKSKKIEICSETMFKLFDSEDSILFNTHGSAERDSWIEHLGC